MQPYWLPYIGYFQLMGAVDAFVLYDDVQWMQRSWINRNRILVEGQPHWLSCAVAQGSARAPINQRTLPLGPGVAAADQARLLRQIEAAYRKAPQFAAVWPLVQACVQAQGPGVAVYVAQGLRWIAGHLGIHTPLVWSSELSKAAGLKGQDHILEICRVMGASHYINPIGGQALYDRAAFAAAGIELAFLQARPVTYPQFAGHAPVPFLSIIDVLMFNDASAVAGLLQQYDLC